MSGGTILSSDGQVTCSLMMINGGARCSSMSGSLVRRPLVSRLGGISLSATRELAFQRPGCEASSVPSLECLEKRMPAAEGSTVIGITAFVRGCTMMRVFIKATCGLPFGTTRLTPSPLPRSFVAIASLSLSHGRLAECTTPSSAWVMRVGRLPTLLPPMNR